MSNHLGRAAELAVIANGQEDLPVAGLERVIGIDVRMRVAGDLRRSTAHHEIVGLGMQQGNRAIIQRHVQVLTTAGRVALVQGHQNGDHRVQASAHVDHRCADAGWTAGWRAVDAGHAADGLHHSVITRIAAHGAGRAIAGDVAMDQAGEFLAENLLIAQAPFRHLAGLEILNHHVRAVQQLEQDVLAVLL